MGRSSKATPKFSDNLPNPGPGLFTVERDRIGIEAVRKAVTNAIELENLETPQRFSTREHKYVEDIIADFVTYYHSDRDYDARLKHREMKVEARRLRDSARRLGMMCRALSRHVVVSINQEVSRIGRSGPEHFEHVGELVEKLELINRACTPIVTRKIRKVGDAAVDRACVRLWNLRERITRRRFIRQWDTALGTDRQGGRREFVGPDARFVQVLLEAVDPNVEVASIRTGLKRAAAARPLRQDGTKKHRRS